MRSRLLFNQDWEYAPQKVVTHTDTTAFEAITLPHTNKIFPVKNFDDAEYQFVSTYRKRFSLPEPLQGRRLYLDFDGAMLATTVTINGHTFDEYRGGFTPFFFDITDYVQEGDNDLLVFLDSTERKDIPPYGNVVDYMTFGGIYRDVWLRYVETAHLTNVRVKTRDVLTTPRLEIDLYLRNQGVQSTDITAEVTLKDTAGQSLATAQMPQTSLTDSSEKHVTLTLDSLPQIALWTLDKPTLYTVDVDVFVGQTRIDTYQVRFGFREARFEADGFYLNGERVNLRGLNRHQNYPYIGCAAPARLQRKDAEIIKFDLSCNIVRTSHYPQSPYFLDRCDEIGLIVFEEIPGWQFIGDEEWQSLSLRDVRAMIERDWNHPSIIIWGVRINESQDNTAFYTATNQLAHDLDDTRQTGGVRYFPFSEFLEDVYTFNDFYGPLEPTQSPWLITEFNGHMFSTKSFDGEERRIEHALRHARYHARVTQVGGISGAIAWCAFDYNTHKEFGSGDRICYHGVLDIFRLPKWAAHWYASQRPPEQGIVLQAATLWSMGDRSEGGNNPVYIFTNCDAVEVFAGPDRIGVFKPAHDEFPGLPHPPVKVDGLGMRWGEQFGDLQLIGYQDDEPVAEQWIACDGKPHTLKLALDDTELNADGADMTRLVFAVVDHYGNPLPYVSRAISFEIEGPAELIGENPFAIIGGQAALYVKARHEIGTVIIRAKADRLPDAEVSLTIN